MTEDVAPLDEIPEDNPFREQVEELREDGATWTEVFEKLDAAFTPVDKAAYNESFREVPEFKLKVTVPDEKSTSGKRYETFTRIAEDEDEARNMIKKKPEVIEVAHAEQIGTAEVA